MQFVVNVGITVVAKELLPENRFWKAPQYSLKNLKWSGLLCVGFLLNVICGLYGLRRVNIPMFLAIRRTSTFIVFCSDVFILKRSTTQWRTIGVVLITFGGVTAVVHSIQLGAPQDDYSGYLFVVLNNVFTVLYFQLVKILSEYDSKSFTAEAQSFYTSLCSIPVLVLLIPLIEPISYSEVVFRPESFYIVLGVSSILGCVLTFSQSLCTLVNSPIAMTISGNMKDVFLTIVGLLLFNNILVTPQLLLGITLSLLGASIYSYDKYQELKFKTK